MSVNFNRKLLIQVTEQALAEDLKAQQEYRRAWDRYLLNHAAEGTKESRERAKALRDGLTAALKRSGPIEASELAQGIEHLSPTTDLRDFLYRAPEDYLVERRLKEKGDLPKALLNNAERVETRALLKVLQAATGDVVSVNELKLLGLKNLQPVFTAAAGV